MKSEDFYDMGEQFYLAQTGQFYLTVDNTAGGGDLTPPMGPPMTVLEGGDLTPPMGPPMTLLEGGTSRPLWVPL